MNNTQQSALKNPCRNEIQIKHHRYSHRSLKDGKTYNYSLYVDILDTSKPTWTVTVQLPQGNVDQNQIKWAEERGRDQLCGVGLNETTVKVEINNRARHVKLQKSLTDLEKEILPS